MTVIAIAKEGWCYAPWKKPKGGAKSARPADAKQLFDVADVVERNGQRAMRAMHMYAFEREGKMDKGVRNDELVADIAVGMTLRFKIHEFMYEVKITGGRGSVFPTGVEFIPEFSLVEVMVLPGESSYSCLSRIAVLILVEQAPPTARPRASACRSRRSGRSSTRCTRTCTRWAWRCSRRPSTPRWAWRPG